MTAEELIAYFNHNYGTSQMWPKQYEVDIETYGNACQAVFNSKHRIRINGFLTIDIVLGINGGLMFKGVELLLAKKEVGNEGRNQDSST